MTHAEKIRALMKKHRLTRPRTAELSGYSLASVDRWLLDPANPGHRPAPKRALELLRMKLQRESKKS